MKLAFLILVLSGTLAEGARVNVEDHHQATWGRSCGSLKTRFTRQQAHLREVEGARAMAGSISLMRTLRRANARHCRWVESGDVDLSAIREVAADYLRQSPCASVAQTAMHAAQNLPEDEKESAMAEAMVLLFSEDCTTETEEVPALDGSEEDMEEEIDDASDEIMGELSSSSQSSLLQQEGSGGYIPILGALHVFGGCPACIMGVLLITVVFALVCGLIMEILVRIFRYLKCKLFHHGCHRYAPATWFRALSLTGCAFIGSGIAEFVMIFAVAR